MAEETKMEGKKPKRRMSSKQTVFAQGVAAGSSPTQAYLAAYGRNHGSDAAKQLKRPGVAEEIERLRAANRESCQLERKDLVDYLTAILFTPVAHVDAEHLLAESYDAYRDGDREWVKVKMVSKMEAVRTLCRMMGWWEADKTPEEPKKTLFYIKKMWDDEPPKLVEGQDLEGVDPELLPYNS
jgi:hypothetical protein